eukprot:6208015-Pleurochrysis_carterae.AAC.2
MRLDAQRWDPDISRHAEIKARRSYAEANSNLFACCAAGSCGSPAGARRAPPCQRPPAKGMKNAKVRLGARAREEIGDDSPARM